MGGYGIRKRKSIRKGHKKDRLLERSSSGPESYGIGTVPEEHPSFEGGFSREVDEVDLEGFFTVKEWEEDD